MIPVALLLAGFITGAINSVAGGGILVTFPVLLAAGLSPLSAAITTLVVVVPGAVSATYASRKDFVSLQKKYFLLVFPCIAGFIVGYILLANTPSQTFNNVVPWLILTAVLLFAFQPQLHNHLHRPPHMRFGSPLILIALGLCISSIYGGYFGAGFGFIMLALLSFTPIKSIFQMLALKNMAVALAAITGTVYFALAGRIDWQWGLIAAIGSSVGGYYGSRYAHKISPHTVRAVVVLIGLSVALYSLVTF